MRLSFFRPDTIQYFVTIIRSTLEHRRKNKVKVNDLIDLTLEALENCGKKHALPQEVGDDQFERDAIVKPKTAATLSPEAMERLLVASIFQLFLGGFETTSTILSVTLFHLAKNPEVQDRVVEEIAEFLEDGERALDFYLLQKFPYLEAVINEATRHYPLTVVERKCVRDFPVPGSDFTIPAGMLVQIPTSGVMQDPEFFPEPERFNPENFSRESREQRSPYSFLSFGQGPRNCIGMRFAMIQMKIALIRMLKDHKIVTCHQTVDKLVVDPLSAGGQPKGGIKLKAEPRN